MHNRRKITASAIFQHTSFSPRSLPKSSDCDSFNSCYSKSKLLISCHSLRIQALLIKSTMNQRVWVDISYEAPILQTSPCPRIILGRYSNTPIPDRYSDSLCFKISDSVLSICRYILTHFSV
jgi:hypothetical protein